MAKITSIDPALARRLLLVLELKEEIGAKEISWALGVIHQIPGYEKISISQAASDKLLREVLIGISREEISATSPKDLEALIDSAQKRNAEFLKTRQGAEAAVKEFIKKSAPSAEKAASPVKPKASISGVSPKKGAIIAMALVKVVGSKESASFLQKIVFAPVKLLIEGTTPIRGGGASAVASYAIVQGITPSKLLPLKGKALALGLSERQFETFVKELSKKKFLITLSDAVNVGRKLSISPQQSANLFIRPSSDGSTVSVFRKPFIDRFFGGIREGFFGKPRAAGVALGQLAREQRIGQRSSNAAAGGLRGIIRFFSGTSGKGSASWGWAAAGGLTAGGFVLVGFSPALASTFFAGAAGSGLAAGANQMGGYGNLLGNLAAGTMSFFSALFASVISTIVTVAVISALAGVGMVAILLFIINSGAYIVPAKQSSFLSYLESPYISLTKTISPTGSVKKDNLPITTTYKVTIGAKKGDLVLKSVKDTCVISKKSGSSDCPDAEGFPKDDEFPPEITEARGDYSFSYTRTFTSEQLDSLVHDTITVVADAPGESGATAQASASLIIGEPPTQCFKLIGDNWPSNYRANAETGIIAIVSKHPVFASKICSGGDVGIVYSEEVKDYWGYHSHAGETDIILYSGGLTTTQNAEYILTHEAGHHLSTIMPESFSAYYHNPAIINELPICTYSATTEPSEGFAEGIALYGSGKPFGSFNRPCPTGSSFQSAYPAHWKFTKDSIFGE